MKKIYLILLVFPFWVQAQPPAHYYDAALGLNGQSLRAALYNIIKGHTQLSYTPGLWNAYYTTDKKPNGKLWDIYSDKPGGTPSYQYDLGTNQCSGSSPGAEGGCYNREHLWPQSKFNSSPPMYTDLWIVYPTDYWVNSKRGDLPYGKVGTAQNTFTNGSKIGSNVYPGAASGNCFEPIDSFKGDVARSYFYIVTRYLADSNSFINWEMADKISLKPWVIQMLLEWHHNDPVSKKEQDRNDAAFALQHNRNPFIDYPLFADCIWGSGDCTSLDVPSVAALMNDVSVYPNPATTNFTVHFANNAPSCFVTVMDMQGRMVWQSKSSSENIEIDAANWAKGLYLLRIASEKALITKKLTLE